MRVQILDQNNQVINTIVAKDAAWVMARYGDRWREEPAPPPPEPEPEA